MSVFEALPAPVLAQLLGSDGNVLSVLNLIMDFVLVAASIWMIMAIRGIGGIVGKTLTWIVAGAIILGIAHLLATFSSQVLGWDAAFNNFVHRLIVLAGFILLVIGFRQISIAMRE